LPDGLTHIGQLAFDGCSALLSIHIPDGLTRFHNQAFSNCRALTSIHLPDSLTRIGAFAFENCSALTSIHLPDSLIHIGASAFAGCTSLTSVNVRNVNIQLCPDNAFTDCSNVLCVMAPTNAMANLYRQRMAPNLKIRCVINNSPGRRQFVDLQFWTLGTHTDFPLDQRERVETMLLCHNKSKKNHYEQGPLHLLPLEILFLIFSYLRRRF